MKIVFLDCADVNPGDLDWSPISTLGEFHWWKKSDAGEAVARINEYGADTVIVDSMKVDRAFMDACPTIRHIAVAATGIDNVDIDYAKSKNIEVTNVPAYSTEAVAQHAMALLLHICNQVELYNDVVSSGVWKDDTEKLYKENPLTLLHGRSIGIIGYGNIGRQMGKLAEAFGMKVNIYSRNPEETVKSDVLSLHCPLTEENRNLINEEFISGMKDGSILINTARGGLVDEQALADALRTGRIRAAGLDVLASEPPEDSPLVGLPNCYITPHIAFTPRETRQRIIDVCADNIRRIAGAV